MWDKMRHVKTNFSKKYCWNKFFLSLFNYMAFNLTEKNLKCLLLSPHLEENIFLVALVSTFTPT